MTRSPEAIRAKKRKSADGATTSRVAQPGPLSPIYPGAMPPPGDAPRYRHADGMTWDDADERAVILDAGGSTLITLNPVGTAIWHQLGEARDVATLTDQLASSFPDVERDQLHADVTSFVDELVGEGLLVTDAGIAP